MAHTEPRKLVNQQKGRQSDPPPKSHLKEDSSQNGRENVTTWYMKSWPRKSKAPAITEVARESISATNTHLSERTRSSTPVSRQSRTQSIDLMKKGRVSTRSLPADVTTTRINVASSRSSPVLGTSNDFSPATKPENGDDSAKEEALIPVTETKNSAQTEEQNRWKESLETDEEPTKPDQPADKGAQGNTASPQPGWFSWLSRSKDGADNSTTDENRQTTATGVTSTKSPIKIEPAPETEPETVNQLVADSEQDASKNMSVEPPTNTDSTSTTTPQKRSWLYMWAVSPATSQEANFGNGEPKLEKSQLVETNPAESSQQVMPDQAESMHATGPDVNATVNDATPVRDVARPTSWLFWSRERQDTGATPNTAQETSTESPGSTQQNNPEATVGPVDAQPAPAVSNLKSKNKGSSKSAKAVVVELGPEVPPESAKQPESSQAKKSHTPPNQVLPSFENTFPPQERPGIFQQLGRLIYYGKGPEPKHVLRVQDRPQIKKALAIGIHGYFPAPLIRNIIGQPTGTSVKFAMMAEKAILQWAATNNSPCQVEKIILEGEGRISERVDLLWKLLLNWIDHVRRADFIMVSCHSQGVPVATMLVAKLIAFGCISSARIGICAMAGVNLGPFPDYRSRWISGSAGELFDFADSKSKVSQDYLTALETVLDSGVKIAYIGSIDDQLVSLESSVFATISHPHICRAVFVDGRVHAPSFVSHLVGFCMKLRNLGISDHGLIRELSSPLAGSLYLGEGHSRLYDDDAVYQLAVRFALETTPAPSTKLEIHTVRLSNPSNPYILPFAMRGVLEEEYVRRELSEETIELLKQFDDWKPSTKVLKDVKFRLEGIRSKL
uniref:YMC020W-like alpha/beta hydrolase domain-containing protein n=1 Tax=Coccidioides posadasii RMSCC 3488 TaxID=454284 RepID=A0A0J6FQV8_COCPO|nr:hypothetical protein CPAG_08151 [Coccidioides posadasii RMSCC 3488]